MSFSHRAPVVRAAATAAVLVGLVLAGLAALPHANARAANSNLNQLNNQLGQQQARQQQLSSSVGSLSGLIASLDRQIQLVQTREAAVRAELVSDRARLARVHVSLLREQARVALLRRRLARARLILSSQLLSGYEGDHPDLVSVVLNAHGFPALLEQINFLGRAETQQQTVIAFTRRAKAQADSATLQLAKLQASVRQITAGAALRARALAGMNSLLSSKQGALQRARSAQQLALQATQARANALRSRISRIQAQRRAAAAAAARAAALAAAQANPAPTAPSGPAPAALGPGGGWAIPYAIVLCESGGQNLPPNSAGASGYYQIMPATWKLFGGPGPAAYLASKAEQDAIATKIWNGGAGASNWVCAGIVGIH
ncbi:MAG: transglycosylase family protein [Solirubrobacteraceae bacterium]